MAGDLAQVDVTLRAISRSIRIEDTNILVCTQAILKMRSQNTDISRTFGTKMP